MRYSKETRGIKSKAVSQWDSATVNVVGLMSHIHKTPDGSEVKVCKTAKALC